MIVDKTNGNVKYNDEAHLYWDEDGVYTSVTTLIGFYKSKFDEDFWSSYKALEALTGDDFQRIKPLLLNTKKFHISYLESFKISEEYFNAKKKEVLQSYEDKRRESCERGTRIHAEFENEYYKKSEHKLPGLKGDFKCKKDYYEFDFQKGVYPEYLISLTSRDGKLKVAGQIDLLIKDGNDIIIRDYKTNAKIDTKSYFDKRTKKYSTLAYPLNNLQDCNYIHYSLQLSLYAYLIQQINPEFNIKELTLIHIDHDNNTSELKCEYLKDDIERMLKHYKQHVLTKSHLDKDKPIIY